MNVFKQDIFYRVAITLLFLTGGAVFLIMYLRNSDTSTAVVFGAFAVFLLIYAIHAWIVQVSTDGITLCSRSFAGVRRIQLSDIEAISQVKVRGRFIFFIMTKHQFVVISTLLENFEGLRKIIKEHVPSKVYADMGAVAAEAIVTSSSKTKKTLGGLLVLYIALAVYIAMTH